MVRLALLIRSLACGMLLVLLAASGPARAQQQQTDTAQEATMEAAPQDAFVRVEGEQFMIGERPYDFLGVNLWYGMNLGSTGEAGNRERLVRELDRLEEMGVTNLRVMAASAGPASEPWRVKPALQSEPGVYDEDLLRGLDFLLAEAGKRDMRLVLVLNNFFQWTGGMAQYVSWATGTDIPYPHDEEHSWTEFQEYAARFYKNDEAQQHFLDLINTLVHRTNTVTGQAYRADPTIMAWQLANEPRGFSKSDAYVEWVRETAGIIQLMDENHLVSLGGEGKLEGNTGTQFKRVSRMDALDYLTAHLWIENWGWYEPEQPEETFSTAVGRIMGYVADHAALARQIGKPLVFEEFGISRDGGAYDPEAPTTYRDRYYQTLFETLYRLAQEDGAVAGGNVWSWSGDGRPDDPGSYWEAGDPFTGDPPHEKQGWYSIYEGDERTLGVIARYAQLMDELGAPAETNETAAVQESGDAE